MITKTEIQMEVKEQENGSLVVPFATLHLMTSNRHETLQNEK